MAELTGISWADGTHNWWVGCQETGSPACVPCYARELNARYAPKPADGSPKVAPNWGPHAPRRLTTESNRAQVALWNKEPARLKSTPAGTKPFIFGGSLMDWADNKVDLSWRAEQFAAYRAATNLVFLMLTKRIGIAEKLIATAGGWGTNMALGITVVNQAEADRDIPKLLAIARRLRAYGTGPAFLFLSIEPICGRIELKPEWLAEIAWVIVGGPTDQGVHKAWPIDPDWLTEIYMACVKAGSIFHFKQWGEWLPIDRDYPARVDGLTGSIVLTVDGKAYKESNVVVMPGRRHYAVRMGKKHTGNRLWGRTWDERPRVAA